MTTFIRWGDGSIRARAKPIPKAPIPKKSYTEELHPRDDHGRWTDNGGDGEVAQTRSQKYANPKPEQYTSEDYQKWDAKFLDGAWWHGTPSGRIEHVAPDEVAAYGIHVGSREAAREALESRIGRRADGKDWDGTEEYGKTLIASSGTGLVTGNAPHYPTLAYYAEPIKQPGGGFVDGPPVRAEDREPGKVYNPRGAVYSDGTPIPLDARPSLFPVRITGDMTNTPTSPMEDFQANGRMRGQITRGQAKRGYFYTEQGEDAGTIAAVLPSPRHLQTYEQWKQGKSATYDEAQHPRDDHGRWTDGGGTSASDYPDHVSAKMLNGPGFDKPDADGQRDWIERVAPKYLEEAKQSGLYDHIKQHGVQIPLQVSTTPADKPWISEGHHRLAVAAALGVDVPVRWYGTGYHAATGENSNITPKEYQRIVDAHPDAPRGRKNFDEAQHPRDDHGRWTDGGGTTTIATPDEAVRDIEQGAPQNAAYRAITAHDYDTLQRGGALAAGAHNEERLGSGAAFRLAHASEVLKYVEPDVEHRIIRIDLANPSFRGHQRSGYPGDVAITAPLTLANIDKISPAFVRKGKSMLAWRLDIERAKAGTYDEALHPRDDHGRWTDSGGGSSEPTIPVQRGIVVTAETDAATAQRFADHKATADDLFSLIDTEDVGMYWWAGDSNGGDASEFAYVGSSESAQTGLDEMQGPDGRDTAIFQVGVQLVGTVAASSQDPTNPEHAALAREVNPTGLMGESFLLPGSTVHLTEVRYDPGDGQWTSVPVDRDVTLPKLAKSVDLRLLLDIERAKAGTYDEAQHPRDDHGRWTSGDGSHVAARITGDIVTKNGITQHEKAVAHAVQHVLTDADRLPKYQGDPNLMTGQCYVATEAAYHMLGAKESGFTPQFIRHEGEAHWFLRDGDRILDITASQFKTPVPYDEAKGKGFLTLQPSHRAQSVIDRAEARLSKSFKYEESQHPRDDRGRWTDGGGAELARIGSRKPTELTAVEQEPVDKAEVERLIRSVAPRARILIADVKTPTVNDLLGSGDNRDFMYRPLQRYEVAAVVQGISRTLDEYPHLRNDIALVRFNGDDGSGAANTNLDDGGVRLGFNMNVLRTAPSSMVDFYSSHPEQTPYTTTGDSRLLTPEMRQQLDEVGKVDPVLFGDRPGGAVTPMQAQYAAMESNVLEAATIHEMGHVASMHAVVEANGPNVIEESKSMASHLLSTDRLNDLMDYGPSTKPYAERQADLDKRFADHARDLNEHRPSPYGQKSDADYWAETVTAQELGWRGRLPYNADRIDKALHDYTQHDLNWDAPNGVRVTELPAGDPRLVVPPNREDIRAYVRDHPAKKYEPGLNGGHLDPFGPGSIPYEYGFAKLLDALDAKKKSATYDEAQHPRDDHGRWTDSGGDGEKLPWGTTPEEHAAQRDADIAKVRAIEKQITDRIDGLRHTYRPKFYPLDISLGNFIDPKVAQQVADSVERFASEFPKLASSINSIRVTTMDTAFADITQLQSAIPGNPAGYDIRLNERYWTHAADFDDRLVEGESSHWAVSNTPGGVMDHELGHLLDYETQRPGFGQPFVAGGRLSDMTSVSRYAAVGGHGSVLTILSDGTKYSPGESFAEAFALRQAEGIDAVPKGARVVVAAAINRAGGDPQKSEPMRQDSGVVLCHGYGPEHAPKAATYDESQHPRDNAGRWTDSGADPMHEYSAQHESRKPWVLEAQRQRFTAAHGIVHRGLNVKFPAELQDRIREMLKPRTSPDQPDMRHEVGKLILDHLQTANEGLGIHWTTDERMGRTAALAGAHGGWPVLITAHATPDQLNTSRNAEDFSGESEVTLKPHAALDIMDVQIPEGVVDGVVSGPYISVYDRAKKSMKAGFDPNEPRDPSGQWTTGGGDAVDMHTEPTVGIRPEFEHSHATPVALLAAGKLAYIHENGLPDPPPKDFQAITADPRLQAKWADDFMAMNNGDSAETRAAYDQFARENQKQFDYLTKTLGIKVETLDHDPYRNVDEMIADVRDNGHLGVLSTAATGSHQYLTDEQNDQFRAVHDAFGHASIGRGFDRNGEEAAYQSHQQMYTPEAVKALASETRGQNAVLITTGSFPDQRIGVLPPEDLKKLRNPDDDNNYAVTRCHHTSCGRTLEDKSKAVSDWAKSRRTSYQEWSAPEPDGIDWSEVDAWLARNTMSEMEIKRALFEAANPGMPFRYMKEAHDVSDEPRDELGRWTATFGSEATLDDAPKEQQAEVKAWVKENLHTTPQGIYNAANRAWESATDEQMKYGLGWYQRVHDDIATRVAREASDGKPALSMEQAVGMLAVQSQNNVWEQNGKTPETREPNMSTTLRTINMLDDDPVMQFDESFYDRWRGKEDGKEGGTSRLPLSREDFEAFQKEFPNGAHLSELDSITAARFMSDAVHKGIGANPPWEAIAHSIDVYRGGDPHDAIVGQKIQSFYNNLLDPKGSTDVTIDRWMLRGMMPDRATARVIADHPDTKSSKSGVVDPNVLGQPDPNTIGRSKQGYLPAVSTYTVFADVVRRIAEERGVTPNDVQAVLWAVARDNYDPKAAELGRRGLPKR